MQINPNSIVFCAFAVFAIGSGIDRTAPAAAASTTHVEAVRSPNGSDRPGLTVLPRVVVVAGIESRADTLERSVMLDAAVGQAGKALAKGVGTSVRRVSLGLPYYAFGRTAARPTE
jgi:hypothetical protein